MGIEYFLFALMIFGMVVAVLFLIFKGFRKENGTGESETDDKEKKLMLLYFEVEDMMNALKEYIEHTEETFRLKAEKLEMMADNIYVKSTPLTEEKKGVGNDREGEEKDEKNIKNLWKDMELKKQAVEYLKNGRSEDEIAELLKISRSEVRFMAKLYGD